MHPRLTLFGVSLCVIGLLAGAQSAQSENAMHFADQGPGWTAELRDAFYAQDQGSQLIPLVWLKALRQKDGTPFAAESLARYGYLPNRSGASDLPVGFTLADSGNGPVVGMTCAACHTRQLTVGTTAYRIDGGPAFADFQAFTLDLDDAVLRALASPTAFKTFAERVLSDPANKPEANARLHDAVSLWSLRFHTLISRSVPHDKPWGPARLDAIAMIYNQLNGLDLGPAPTYLLPDNIAIADAPARYPFLWNAGRQDHSQWGGFAAGGNSALALARNIGEVVGVFARFHPGPKSAATPLDHDYLGTNSANVVGLAAAEGAIERLGPPLWPFPVDHALAERGRAIFDRPTAQGGCATCHGLEEGEPRPPNLHTWKTTTWDVGTDIHQWQILLRSARSGTLEGATIPGIAAPLLPTDMSLNILKTTVTGMLVELQVASKPAPAIVAAMSPAQMGQTVHVDSMTAKRDAMLPGGPTVPPGTFFYEARVLQGVWAAAPYLHNGSVPSLAELLKSPAGRVKRFKVGPAYDIESVGLASDQASTFTLTTTGCEDRASGNSNCGHDYGTRLPADEKRALLEYLKTL